MAIKFSIVLTDDNWDGNIGGWRCPALKIPTSKVNEIFSDGKRLDKGKIETLVEEQILRWHGDVRPTKLVATIEIEKDLNPSELTSSWKKAAIILPIVASLLGGLITHFYSTDNKGQKSEIVADCADSPEILNTLKEISKEKPPYYGNSTEGNVRPQMEAYLEKFEISKNSSLISDLFKIKIQIEKKKTPEKPDEFFRDDNEFRADLSRFLDKINIYANTCMWGKEQ